MYLTIMLPLVTSSLPIQVATHFSSLYIYKWTLDMYRVEKTHIPPGLKPMSTGEKTYSTTVTPVDILPTIGHHGKHPRKGLSIGTKLKINSSYHH